MLKKIRHALLQKREHPFPNFEETPLHVDADEPADVLFAQRLTAVNGHFIYCEDEVSLIEGLLTLAEREKLRRMYAWEPGVKKLLDHYQFPYFETDEGFAEAEAGITGCEALIARSGSVMVSNGSAAGRRLSVYPHIHVVVAYASQLVMDIKDGLDLIGQRYGANMPSLISLVTGPSRTADIEKTLVLGAHGPKSLYVFVLEDRL